MDWAKSQRQLEDYTSSKHLSLGIGVTYIGGLTICQFTISTDAMASCIARSSATMVFIIQENRSFSSKRNFNNQ